jgi:hypothetical protein
VPKFADISFTEVPFASITRVDSMLPATVETPPAHDPPIPVWVILTGFVAPELAALSFDFETWDAFGFGDGFGVSVTSWIGAGER